eukprot:765008-Hanusia_phi.AAC.1
MGERRREGGKGGRGAREGGTRRREVSEFDVFLASDEENQPGRQVSTNNKEYEKRFEGNHAKNAGKLDEEKEDVEGEIINSKKLQTQGWSTFEEYGQV